MALLQFLVLLVPSVWCQVLPRQTSLSAEFSNSSTSPPSTTTTTAAASAITEPPPCCFVVGGTFAVGVNRWWSTTVEEVVATVITNFARYSDNSTKVLNSTTLYKHANQTFPASSFRAYQPAQLSFNPITSPFVVPTNILTGAGAHLTGAGDYAATYIDNRTFAAWDFTDLTIASPTPYNEWMNFGILTFRPSVPTNITTPLTDYGGLCGYWSAYTDKEITKVGESTTSSVYVTTESTYTVGSDTMYLEGTAISTYTTTSIYNPPIYSTKYLSTAPATFVPPEGVTAMSLFAGPPFPGLWHSSDVSSGYSNAGAMSFEGTYIQPAATEIPDGQTALPIPTGLVKWLASNATISSLFPYIEKCYTMPGVGQPTVHAAVNQLTATSSNFVEMGAAPVATTSKEQPTTTQEEPQTTTRETADAQSTINTQPITNAQPTTDAQPTRNVQPTTNVKPITFSTVLPVPQNTVSAQPTEAAPEPTNIDEPASASAIVVVSLSDTPDTGSNDGSHAQPLASTAGDIATASQNVGEIIASLLASSSDSFTGPSTNADGQINQPESPTAGTNVGPVQGTDIGFEPATVETSPLPVTFGGQTVQSGSVVIVSGETATLSDGNLIIASGTETRTEPVIATTALPIFEGQTIHTGEPTVINGATVSIDGNNLIIASGTETRTERVGAMSMPPVIFEGETVQPGKPTVINGATVSIDEENLFIASGTSSRVEQLADAHSPSAPVFEGQAIGRGTFAVVNGATVSLSGNNFIIASGSQTRTELAAATFAGQTVYAGSATVIDGETVSISGTDIVTVSAGTATQTKGLGDAIMSGIGGGSEAPVTSQQADTASVSATPATQTGSAAGRGRNELVYVVAVIGAMRLVA